MEPEFNQLKAWDTVPTAGGRLRQLPTTNGDHCTGDGIKMARALGAGAVDMEAVQVHPTGLIHPDSPDDKVRFLAAEALRGEGGLLLNAEGVRFVDELQKRDHVTGKMWNDGERRGHDTGAKGNRDPFSLVLNGAGSRAIEWHCSHYSARGLMKRYNSGAELAAGLGVPEATVKATFDAYNAAAEVGVDEFGKTFFTHAPFTMDDYFYVGQVGPLVHYTMGGIEATEHAEVLRANGGGVIPGLFAAGEVMGGVHGKNRLGGSSLLDCVVFGRVSGATAATYLLDHLLSATRGGTLVGGGGGGAEPVAVAVDAGGGTAQPLRKISHEEVAKHTGPNDCWVIIDGHVYDMTEFLPDHPGGVKAPSLLSGGDATEQFNLLHKPELLEKYGKPYMIGTLAD